MTELAVKLTELITEHAIISTKHKSIDERYYEKHSLHQYLEYENIVAKQEQLISSLQSCVQKAVNASKYKGEHDFLKNFIR
jgi:hypothetical protein